MRILKDMENKLMSRAADNIRVLITAMVEKAKSGHPGGSMGAAEFAAVLFSKYLKYDPRDPLMFSRDRFFLDPGHMSPLLYSVLTLTGHYTLEELQQFRQWGSVTPGHPELDPMRGIENSSGPLGQGHVMAVGCAIAERFFATRFGELFAHKTFAFISDGGIQEEISQGAGRIAGTLGLHNLIMFYDANEVQLSTRVDQVSTEDTAAKYRAWNWNVIEINGNSPAEISEALEKALAEPARPTLIIGHTIMAKGVVKADGTSLEGAVSTHGQPLSKAGADISRTIKGLGGNPENPFEIWDDVKTLFDQRRQQLIELAARHNSELDKWKKANPEKWTEFERFNSTAAPHIDWKTVVLKPNQPTRNASAAVLGELSAQVQNMIVSSADLANSDKTDGFLKNSRVLTADDFGGRFLHAGVAELTMASIINGIALHGGMIGACGTFFVFSDYIKPALRMSALMELPVKYVFSHDSFRVGEDGPTHEPIEHEAQVRLLEQMDNLHGNMSVLVLRPADGPETLACWQMAMENTQSPTVLIFSRQDVADIAPMDGDRLAEAQKARHGGYLVKDCRDAVITLIANGAETGLALSAAEELDRQGIKTRVASVPSVGLFMRQDKNYRDSVLEPGGLRFGITAGLASTLYPLMTGAGAWKIKALERFGASAPFKVLEEKFGYTTDSILKEIIKFVQS